MNTFLSSKGTPTILPKEVIRATEEEKEAQIATVENLRAAYADEAAKAIKDLQQAAIRNENMFEVLMEATKYCSQGQLTAAMFGGGGGSIEGTCRRVGRSGSKTRRRAIRYKSSPKKAAGFPLLSLTRKAESTKHSQNDDR